MSEWGSLGLGSPERHNVERTQNVPPGSEEAEVVSCLPAFIHQWLRAVPGALVT